ncbi:S-layer homology domain-containing protein [Leptolyngbya sp. FACHB-16]|nr:MULTISPECIES: S-layer homology domain-containing protein [unclassified Leptolyngbya]MBD1913585.1 S-layer homology domain-containing protein [Leptolyngbya sp. FACHB-8]MBD2155756.1 S-layer homology domain-containing protein [Leptolyngbya sp. FACHB-16]
MAVVLPLSSCAGGGLQGAFAPDPQLQQGTNDLQATANLPPDFPQEIPQYPGAVLRSVTGDSSGTSGATSQVQTLWATRDAAAQVAQFYRQEFQKDGWSLESDNETRLFATRDGLEVRLVLADASLAGSPSPETSPDSPQASPEGSPSPSVSPSPEALTEFTLSYGSSGTTADAAPGDATVGSANNGETEAPLTDSWATRPSPNASASARPSPAGSPQSFSDIDQAPTELRSYISDLANLGVLKVTQNPEEFKPNQTITRREYARWLVATNNALFNDASGKQIRLAVASDRPTFQDVPTSDPDFAAIQGLANAGLIPSPLSGSSTTVRFRPNDPLTREDLILWKVPLDTRQALPQASLDAIQQTWGFQDVGQIEPRAQKAVLADFQNSDLSNIRRAFGFTTLFQPKKPVSRAEAAAVLWHFGTEGDGVNATGSAG